MMHVNPNETNFLIWQIASHAAKIAPYGLTEAEKGTRRAQERSSGQKRRRPAGKSRTEARGPRRAWRKRGSCACRQPVSAFGCDRPAVPCHRLRRGPKCRGGSVAHPWGRTWTSRLPAVQAEDLPVPGRSTAWTRAQRTGDGSTHPSTLRRGKTEIVAEWNKRL